MTLLSARRRAAPGWIDPAGDNSERGALGGRRGFRGAGGVCEPHGVAVIIGNRSYEHERVPEVSYAHRDADAFRRYVLDVLGFSPTT